MYANVLFPQKVGDQDSLTYKIPQELEKSIKPGQLVKVPLRRTTKNGLVLKVHNQKPDFKTLNIKSLANEKPLLSSWQIELLNWISEHYFTPPFQTLKLFATKRIIEQKPYRKQKSKDVPVEQKKRTKHSLTKDQKKAVEETTESKTKNTFLIHGITGSGKTEIYTQIAKHHIKNNKQVLLLVPEISLTPQMIAYFENALQLEAVTIHSKLSDGERYRAWQNIWENKAKLIIGSRSAIFSPFQDLGAIIIDEEHETSYKQDSSPRYSVHEVATKMQKLLPQLKLIYGSATPSIETAEKLKDSTIHLKKRINKSPLPKVEIIDLRDEFKKKNYSIFSDTLKESLTQTLNSKQQAILFLNRRGSASSVVCRDCGFTSECKTCQIPYTYHAKTLQNASLICHHCGTIDSPPTTCPNCQGVNIRFLGIGTQRIENDLKELFPSARILRADKDTTAKKHGFAQIYQDFKAHKADFLIGTQMIAKGLHLPKVNLVGVVLADIGLNIPDFRTSERNFQLLTQVAGRAGRGQSPGKVIIQTYNPENTALQFAKNHNYSDFFNHERQQRALLKNPPFSNLAKIQIEDPSHQKAQNVTEQVERKLWQIARENNLTNDLEINTYPAYFIRLRGKYRYIILIKTQNKPHTLLEKLPKEYIMASNIKIDVSPQNVT